MSRSQHLFLCTGTTCTQEGAEDSLHRLLERLDEKKIKGIRLTLCRCLGQCGEGPNLVIYGDGPDQSGTWYGHLAEETIDDFVSQHLLKGERLTHLVRTPNE
ncbi:MAG: (2Fe-2S) ferredoxin domain-containing protein [Nitrospirota bacterium]